MEPKLPARRPRTTLPGGGRALRSNSNEFFALFHYENFPDEPEPEAEPEPKKSPTHGWDTPGPAGAPEPSASPTSTASHPAHDAAEPDPPPWGGVVGGRAFLDANVNGAYDDGDDEGVADVVARLFSCDGEPVGDAVTTLHEGTFRWDNLPWGSYLVVLEPPGGYAASTAVGGHGGDVFELTEGSSSGGSASGDGTACFAMREGGPSHVELSFGMRSDPAPAIRPTNETLFGDDPTPSTVAASRPPGGTSSRPTPAPDPPVRDDPAPAPGEDAPPGSSFAGSAAPSPPPTGDRPPPSSPEGSSSPAAASPPGGARVGPIRSDGLRMTLFGIEGVRDEEELTDGMARYVREYFDSGGGYAFDVDVDIRIAKQTANLDSIGEYMSNYANGGNRVRARRLQGQPSVEILYDQISTYRTIDPTFVDVSYILQEPFATAESRQNYVAFLQLLSPSNFANVSSVSPVILPPPWETPTYEEVEKNGSGLNVGLSAGLPLVLLSAMLFACLFCKGRRKVQRGGEAPEPPEAKGETKEETRESKNRSDSFSDLFQSAASLLRRSQEFLSWQSVATQSATQSATADASSVPEEFVIEISLPPGRVGCVIDSSPERGPYVCEVQEFSCVRDHVEVGDRIVAVDGENVERLNAIAVSRMLGSRSENEERRVTLLRGFVPYDDTLAESSDLEDGGDSYDRSLDIFAVSLDMEDITEENSGEETESSGENV